MSLPLRIFLAGLALGFLTCPEPGWGLRWRCQYVLSTAGARAVVSVVPAAQGHQVLIGLRRCGLTREAAAALISTVVAERDVVAVVSLPESRPFNWLAWGAVGGCGIGLLGWWRGVQARVQVHVPVWRLAQASLAVTAFRQRLARERGFRSKGLRVVPGLQWRLCIDGIGVDLPGPQGLTGALEARLVELFGPEELDEMLAAHEASRPGQARQLLARHAPGELLALARNRLRQGLTLHEWISTLEASPC